MQNRFKIKGRGVFWLLIFFIAVWHKPILRIYFTFDYRDEIRTNCVEHHLSPVLIGAIVFVESRFNPEAISSKGARGLMQIMPSTGKWAARQMDLKNYSEQDLIDPMVNLNIGTWYLAYLKKYFNGNETKALAAYNAGHSYVEKWMDTNLWDGDLVRIENIPFPETKKYLFRINLLRKIYQYLYPELTL